MKKIILLTTTLLSSISAYAACTPPTTLKCNCAHPIIENGVLACGASYCGDKKCMPNGSCCESEKYCEVGDNKYCCADGQTCDTTKGCVETVDECNGQSDYTTCQNGNGYCLYKHCFKYSNTMEMNIAQLKSIKNSCSLSTSSDSFISQGGCCLSWGSSPVQFECREVVSAECGSAYEGESFCNGKNAVACTTYAKIWTWIDTQEEPEKTDTTGAEDSMIFCIN